MPLNIVPVIGVPPDKLREIQKYLVDCFRNAHTARGQQIDSDYGRWLDNYNAKPAQEVRSTPWVGASNFIPQLTRMHTDILAARIYGVMFGTKDFWRVKTFNQPFKHERMMALAAYMEMKSQFSMGLPTKMDEVVLETVKTGTTTMKARWQEDEEIFVDQDSKSTPIQYADLELDISPFYDYYPYPLSAPCLDKVLVSFFRNRFTKNEIEYRVAKGIFTRKAADLLLMGEKKVNQQESDTAQRRGIQLTVDTARPFTTIECHFQYQLTPGQNNRLIAVINPQVESEDGILRLYHGFMRDPRLGTLVDFRIIPTKDSYYGIGAPEILEGAQEEQADLHNSRRNSNKIANTPTFKKRRTSYGNVAPASQWYPGKVWELDNMQDLEMFEIPGNYNSMIDEENMLLQLAERYTGVTQPMQGMGTGSMGKKGTYNTGGTLALLTEGNRRLNIYISRMRRPMAKLGKISFTSYRDFGDPKELDAWGKNGQLVKECFDYSTQSSEYRNMVFDFYASDSGANKEVDRQNILLMSNTAQAYYGQVMQLAQMVAGIPDGQPAKQVGLAILDGAYDLFNRVLTAFDIDDRDSIVPNVRKLLGAGSPEEGQPAPVAQPTPEPGTAVPDARMAAVLGGAQGNVGGPGNLPPQRPQ
jgi:hypothetical protein